MSVDDTKPAPLSAARLAEIREWAQAAKHDTRKRSLQLVLDVEALLAHLDALAPRAPVDGDALGFGVFLGDMRETDNRATREAWAQMDPDPKAEYVSRALDLHAIGYAAGRNEGEAARSPIIHADFAGGLSVCSQTGETTKDVDRITCHACLARLYDVANDDADKMRGEVERLTAELAKARAALTPRAPSTREQRVERLGKIAGELLQIGEDTVSEYLARDAEIARLTAELAEARAAEARSVDALNAAIRMHHEGVEERAEAESAARRRGAQEERERIEAIVGKCVYGEDHVRRIRDGARALTDHDAALLTPPEGEDGAP